MKFTKENNIMDNKKTFRETKVGAFLASKAPKVLTAMEIYCLIKELLVW